MSGEFISLYLDLEDGQVADLEVVARTALAWTSAIKELAYVIDPSIQLRIEITSGTPGSLSLNSFIRSLKNSKGEQLTLKALIVVIMSWLGSHALDFTFEKIGDMVVPNHEQTFTEEQKKELADIINKAVKGRFADNQVKQIFREAERDPVIKGIGASNSPSLPPASIVPRSDFRERAGQSGAVVEQIVTRRIITEPVRVLLISPVLIPGNRRWKLRSAQGEFGATIKDQTFIEDVLLGTTSIRMRAGIEMDIVLETTEEFKQGVWQVLDRNVTKVNKLIEPSTQINLFDSRFNDSQSPNDDD